MAERKPIIEKGAVWNGLRGIVAVASNPWCCQPQYCQENAPEDYANPDKCKDCILERRMAGLS